jgi:hypothetical protein
MNLGLNSGLERFMGDVKWLTLHSVRCSYDVLNLGAKACPPPQALDSSSTYVLSQGHMLCAMQAGFHRECV